MGEYQKIRHPVRIPQFPMASGVDVSDDILELFSASLVAQGTGSWPNYTAHDAGRSRHLGRHNTVQYIAAVKEKMGLLDSLFDSYDPLICLLGIRGSQRSGIGRSLIPRQNVLDNRV